MGVLHHLLALGLVALVAAQDAWIDIHSGEHFDDVVGNTDGSNQFAINVGLVLYKRACIPNFDLRKFPPTHNLIYFQANTETAKEHVWYKQAAEDDLRTRYAKNATSCQVALFFKKGQKLRGKPAGVWDPKVDKELDHWLWKMATIEVTLVNTFDRTLGITTKHFEYSPPLKYQFIYPNEEYVLKTYPGYEIVIHSTDKRELIYTFIVQKKEKIVLEPNMVPQDIWPVKHSDWEKSHRWNQWAKSNALRHLGNMKQPLFVHNYTTTGYRLKDIPASAYTLIKEFYKNHKAEREYEEPSETELLVINKFEVLPSIVQISDTLIEAVSGFITPIMESWCNCKLDYSATWGILELHKGNVVQNHVTYLNRFVITALMHIEEQPANTSTPITVVGYDGVKKEIVTKPGQMLLIESAKVIHGRPKVFQGKNLALLEMSFVPREGWNYKVDGWDLVNEKTGAEEPLWQKETEFTRNRKMFTVKDEL